MWYESQTASGHVVRLLGGDERIGRVAGARLTIISAVESRLLLRAQARGAVRATPILVQLLQVPSRAAVCNK